MYLILAFWPAALAGAALGLSFAALGGPGQGSVSSRPAARWIGLAGLTLGALASWLQLVPGRPGLWLDAAVLIGAAYGVGSAAGEGLRRALGRRPPAPPGAPASDASPSAGA